MNVLKYFMLPVVLLSVVSVGTLSAAEGQKSTIINADTHEHGGLCRVIIEQYGHLVQNLECEDLAETKRIRNAGASDINCMLLDDVACSLRQMGVSFIVRLPIVHGSTVTIFSVDDRGKVCSVGLVHNLNLKTAHGGKIVECKPDHLRKIPLPPGQIMDLG